MICFSALLNLDHGLRAVASAVYVGFQKEFATPQRIVLLVFFRIMIDFLVRVLVLAILRQEKLILLALIDGRCIHSLHCGIVSQR